jgi:hypothetical protein
VRFFTQAWHRGDLPEAEADQVWAAYKAHLASLGPSLPSGAHRLCTDVSLHDALVVRMDHPGDNLELLCRAGSAQAGYVDVRLLYGNVIVSVLMKGSSRAPCIVSILR